MSPRPVSTSRRADEDIASAIDFHLEEGHPDRAARFVDELEQAFTLIAAHPAIGSTRLAAGGDIPGVRSFGLQRSPYVAFYLEIGDGIRVIRVLHTRRDLSAELGVDS